MVPTVIAPLIKFLITVFFILHSLSALSFAIYCVLLFKVVNFCFPAFLSVPIRWDPACVSPVFLFLSETDIAEFAPELPADAPGNLSDIPLPYRSVL